MKKLVTGLAWCLLALLLLLPEGCLVCAALGWRLTLTKAWVYGLVLAGLSVGTLIAAIFAEDRGNREREENTREAAREEVHAAAVPRVFYALLPASLLNGVFLLLQSSNPIIVFLILATVFGCGFLCLLAQRGLPRRISLSLSGLLLVPLLLLAFGSLFFGGIGQRRVVRQVPSPDGSLWAEIVDDDQGALGGTTLVEICPRGLSGDFGVRVSRRIYAGKWSEFNTMEIHWREETCLEINGRDYQIR